MIKSVFLVRGRRNSGAVWAERL